MHYDLKMPQAVSMLAQKSQLMGRKIDLQKFILKKINSIENEKIDKQISDLQEQ